MRTRFQRYFPPVENTDLSASTLMSTYDSAPFIIEYLRRRDSIDENYTPENFTFHIPEHLKHFLAEVVELPDEDQYREIKINLAKRIVLSDLIKYEQRLENIVQSSEQYPSINDAVLTVYRERANSIKRFIYSILGMESQEQHRQVQQLSFKPSRSH